MEDRTKGTPELAGPVLAKTPVPIPHPDSAETREALEKEKLRLEVERLSRPWWGDPEYLKAFAPVVLAVVGLVVALASGLLEPYRLKVVQDARAIAEKNKRMEQEMKALQEEMNKERRVLAALKVPLFAKAELKGSTFRLDGANFGESPGRLIVVVTGTRYPQGFSANGHLFEDAFDMSPVSDTLAASAIREWGPGLIVAEWMSPTGREERFRHTAKEAIFTQIRVKVLTSRGDVGESPSIDEEFSGMTAPR